MKNKEYVLQNHADELLNAIPEYGMCEVCKTIGCIEYCKSPKAPLSCTETFESWLDQEHTEPLRYPIGTVVEFDTRSSMVATNRLGYYNGADGNNTHRICIYKENIGKQHLGFLVNTEDIKKVGD